MTYYFTPRAVIKAFGPDFQLLGLQGLGVVTPPADRKRLAHRLPRFYRMLCRIDDMLACRRPWHGWGDFFMLTMRYSPHADNAQ